MKVKRGILVLSCGLGLLTVPYFCLREPINSAGDGGPNLLPILISMVSIICGIMLILIGITIIFFGNKSGDN
jgi:hypothetical protein